MYSGLPLYLFTSDWVQLISTEKGPNDHSPLHRAHIQQSHHRT